MSNGNGHRWSRFWWQDHQGDAALRACTLAARGYWLEMLCVMHTATPVGHLVINGRRPTDRQMAAICGCSEKEARTYTAELEAAGVFSRTDDGTIWCRRMVRDAAASENGRTWGKAGGNPNLKASHNRVGKGEDLSGGVNPPLNPKVNGGPNLQSTEAEAEAEEEPPYPHAVGDGTPASPGTPPGSRTDRTNPRSKGTNPRANAVRVPWRSGAVELIYNEGLGAKDSEEFQAFIAAKGLRYGTS